LCLVNEVIKDVWTQNLTNDISAATFEAHELLEEGKDGADLRWQGLHALWLLLASMHRILEKVAQKHKVFHEV